LNLILQAIAGAGTDTIVYFPAGSYIITDTITIPPGIKIVGECWAQLVATGPNFGDADNPRPFIRVGRPGDQGSVEISDMLFTTKGATPGLIAVEWNIHESSTGSAAMWDTHFRIGGAKGTDMQVADCPTTSINTECMGGAMMLHVTRDASIYLENVGSLPTMIAVILIKIMQVWAWVADHDIDDEITNAQVNIFVARGMLVESQGPSWFYGTASEHSIMYQYQLYGAQTLYMSMIQTETPYMQPNPQAPAPFTPSNIFPDDPDFGDCAGDINTCAEAWGLRVVSSSDIVIGGAGLYSWFNDYTQACLNTQDCQKRILSIEASGHLWIFNLITIGTTEMVTAYINSTITPVLAKDNTNAIAFPNWSIIALFLETSDAYNQTTYPVYTGWVSFGDSYAAGIGAGNKFKGDIGVSGCSQYTNAHPLLLNAADGIDQNRNHEFRFLACSGAKTSDVLSGGKRSQIDAFTQRNWNKDIGTLSIGGNDVDFARVLDACLFRFWPATDCNTALTDAQTKIDNIGGALHDTYNAIFAARAAGDADRPEDFRLYVSGYARFFNENTTDCDQRSMGYWPWRKPKITQDLRQKMNTMVLSLNTQIQNAITEVNKQWGNDRVIYVDIDRSFELHRFCEPGVIEPDNNRGDTWFFLLQGSDSAPPNRPLLPSNDTDIPVLPDPGTCAEQAEESGVWADYFMCGIVTEMAQNPGAAPDPFWNETLSDGLYFDSYDHTFHPKSVGQYWIEQAYLNKFPEVFDDQLIEVLIMFDCSEDDYNAFIETIPTTRYDMVKYSEPDISLRAFKTRVTKAIGSEILDDPLVVGISWNYNKDIKTNDGSDSDDGMSSFSTNTTNAFSTHTTSAFSSNRTNIDRRQITNDDLLDWQENSPWHLELLSRPPYSTQLTPSVEVAYWNYDQYVFDPQGGKGAYIYVMDTGKCRPQAPSQSQVHS
jgi:hypothetical protein